jgi:hypothetical protein
MKVLMTNNAPGTSYVGRLNYISIYPAWNEGVPSLAQTNMVGVLTNNDSSWAAATHNAAVIQQEIDNLSINGVIAIPQGTFYVAQPTVDETKPAYNNTAILVSRDNVEVRGFGKTNTVLIAHNRATTIFFVGRDNPTTARARTNLTFRDMTLEGQPHVMATNSSGGTRWEDGALLPNSATFFDTGSLLVTEGEALSLARNVNILITNCLFRNPGISSINFSSLNNNCAVRNCEFWMRDKGTNGAFKNIITTSSATTSNVQFTGATIFTRNPNDNLIVMDNTFTGNPTITNVNPAFGYVDACDGLVWFQGGGNWFVGRNGITNYLLEAIQVNAGPAAIVGNYLKTWNSRSSTTALHGNAVWASATVASNEDYVISVVGNQVIGGRHGHLANNTNGTRFTLHYSGNTLSLYSAFNDNSDYPGAVVTGSQMKLANVCGNTLLAGDHGVRWLDNCTNAIVLRNHFTNVTYRALAYDGTNGAVRNVAVLKNELGQGASYHLKVRPQEAGNYFLWSNHYYNSNGVSEVSPFFDYPGAPVHLIP